MPIFLFKFPGLENTPPEFRRELVAMSKRLGTDPNGQAAVMYVESRFNPAARNPFRDKNGESAVGINQFMPFVLRHWGLTVAEVERMSAVEQLVLTERFYAPYLKGKQVTDPGTLYMLNFLPKYAFESESFVLGRRDSEEIRDGLRLHAIYAQNAGLDVDKDGDIEVGEVKRVARVVYERAKAAGPLDSIGDRIVMVSREALGNGPIGNGLSTDAYRKFISCGLAPPLTDPDADIAPIRTSCAVFVRAVLHHAGRPVTRPGRIGQGIVGGWLEGLSFRPYALTDHPAWVDEDDEEEPEPGSVFYRAYRKGGSGSEAHVGVLLERVGDLWLTAEGGGSLSSSEAKRLVAQGALKQEDVIRSNGTVCRLSASPKDIFAKDSLNRSMIGWWKPSLLNGFSDSVAKPPVPKLRPTLRKAFPNDELLPHVKALQLALNKRGERLKVDGWFHTKTETAVRSFQKQQKLLVDGVVGRNTWTALNWGN